MLRISLRLTYVAVLAAVLATGTCHGYAAPGKPERVKTYSRLLKILKQHEPRYYGSYRSGLEMLAEANSEAVPNSSAGDFSRTTVQVAGVEEGDSVSTDGGLICQINNGRVLLIQADTPENLGLAAQLDYSTENFYPQELYLDSERLVVVGTSFLNPLSASVSRRLNYPLFFSSSTLQAKIYDVRNPASPRKLREVEVEGDRVATRKIGSILYLVTRQYPGAYAIGLKGSAVTRLATPAIRDSRKGRTFRNVGPLNCWYFPGFDDPSYLTVAAVDLAKTYSTVNATTFLGAGDQVYCSGENLYVTSARLWDVFLARPMQLSRFSAIEGGGITLAGAGVSAALEPDEPEIPEVALPLESTDIYKFELNNGTPVFAAAGAVPGSILNSYSLDEYAGNLRVATTVHGGWLEDGSTANNVYVLDDTLQLLGKVEDIARGEEIYAARFMGTRLFLVTFQQIDPLFGIDLSDPANPTVAGQLELPGYSNFLLPLDENHLIGFGKDVWISEPEETDGDVPWWGGRAFFQGVKLALFDVRDLGQPLLLQSLSFGTRGTDSPALSDPHAVLFDPGRGLLAFPISVVENTESSEQDLWAWGEASYQGAYVFNVSAENGMDYRGAISHIPAEEPVWAAWDRHISRIVRVGETLYTLSDAEVRANDLATLDVLNAILLPEAPGSGGWDDVVVRPFVGSSEGFSGK